MQLQCYWGSTVRETHGAAITVSDKFSCGVLLTMILRCIHNKILYIKYVDQMMMMKKRAERVDIRQEDKHSHKEINRERTEDELAWDCGRWPTFSAWQSWPGLQTVWQVGAPTTFSPEYGSSILLRIICNIAPDRMPALFIVGYFMIASVATLCSVNGRDYWWNGKDLKGSSSGLVN